MIFCRSCVQLQKRSRHLWPKPQFIGGMHNQDIDIPVPTVAIDYDDIVDVIKEDLINASMLRYAKAHLKYYTQELIRKGKVVKRVARIRHRDYKARRITLKADWKIEPRSR